MSDQSPVPPLHRYHISRREVLGALGILGTAGALVGVGGDIGPVAAGCVITPELTEGPFFVDEKLNRHDLAGDTTDASVHAGLPLYLRIAVMGVGAGRCAPLSDVQIDLWHASPDGRYSDVGMQNTRGQHFLRGYQLTDHDGIAIFKTVYPGWYPGRTVHIHLKARWHDPARNVTREATTQLFFDDAVTDRVFARAPYNTRGARDGRNNRDGIFGGRDGLLLDLRPLRGGAEYQGLFTLGLRIV